MSLFCMAIYLSACAPTSTRFYTGTPLPSNQVAIVLLHRHCILDDFMGKGLLRTVSAFEVLPGHYDLCIRYHYSGTYSTSSSQGCVNLKLNTQPGHVYYIYSEFPKPGLWQPTFADFVRDEDFARFDHGLLRYIDNGSEIKARSTRYLQGERLVIKLSERGYWE